MQCPCRYLLALLLGMDAGGSSGGGCGNLSRRTCRASTTGLHCSFIQCSNHTPVAGNLRLYFALSCGVASWPMCGEQQRTCVPARGSSRAGHSITADSSMVRRSVEASKQQLRRAETTWRKGEARRGSKRVVLNCVLVGFFTKMPQLIPSLSTRTSLMESY